MRYSGQARNDDIADFALMGDHLTMDIVYIDCDGAKSEAEVWQRYVAAEAVRASAPLGGGLIPA